jgi:hypothetical protein
MAKAKLGALLQDLSGKVGNAVFVKSREGTVVRARVSPTNPNTPSQQAARARLTTVSKIYKGFNATQEAAWDNYAGSIKHKDEITGKSQSPTAMNAFCGLGTKFLQVTPGGTVPTTPPANSFSGDSITLTALAGTGKVTFTATGGNTVGTKTELLLQPLKSRNRNPQKGGYRTKSFVSFVPGTLSFDVNVPPGYYAAAYRFVNTTTGQETALVPIGVSQVTFAVSSGATSGKKKAA